MSTWSSRSGSPRASVLQACRRSYRAAGCYRGAGGGDAGPSASDEGRLLQRVEAVVQRQQRVAPERYDHRFLLDRQDGRLNGLRPYPRIADVCPACATSGRSLG